MIDACIRSMDGGFERVNGYVQETIYQALTCMKQSFDRDFAGITSALQRVRTLDVSTN